MCHVFMVMLYYCATSILDFLYYGQTVAPKYFHELAEKQNGVGFEFVPQYISIMRRK